MNTRGLMELIVLNVGYDLGVIPKSMFFMLTVMALTTTYMTAPLLRRLMNLSARTLGVEEEPLPARFANGKTAARRTGAAG